MKSFLKSHPYALGVSVCAWCVMCVGAGNVMVPVTLTAHAGTSLSPIVEGILVAGVALLAWGMMAGVSGHHVKTNAVEKKNQGSVFSEILRGYGKLLARSTPSSRPGSILDIPENS